MITRGKSEMPHDSKAIFLFPQIHRCFPVCIHREFRKEFSATLMQDGAENVNMFN